MTKLRVCVHEYVFPSDVERQISSVACSPQFLDLLLEVEPLVVKVEQVWHVLHEFRDCSYVFLGTFTVSSACTEDVLDKLIQNQLVLEAEEVELVKSVGGDFHISEDQGLSLFTAFHL